MPSLSDLTNETVLIWLTGESLSGDLNPSSDAPTGTCDVTKEDAEVEDFVRFYKELDDMYKSPAQLNDPKVQGMHRKVSAKLFDVQSESLSGEQLKLSSGDKVKLAVAYVKKPRKWPHLGEGEEAVLKAVCASKLELNKR